MDVGTEQLFREAMSHLASGAPCGLAATSLTSYSAHPPSLLVSIWHGSRCHATLELCGHFGVHLP